jgi:transcription termination factor Rho
MDYTFIIDELRAASLFDLFRLRAALSQQLEDPQRIDQVRRRLRPGMPISYFDEAQNRLIEATVIELRRTRLLVENRHDNQRWSIPFGAVNIDGVDTDIRAVATEPQALDRSRLKVGDAVGFRDRQNQDKYGRVVALNQKTATIITQDNQKWRVAYQFLFPVIASNE